MRTLHSSALAAIAFAGCVSQAETTPAYGEYDGNYAGLSTGPGEPDGSWSGPPGGDMDPGYGYEDPSLAQSPSAQSPDPNAEGVYGGAMNGQPEGEAYADPMAADSNAGDPNVEWAGATAEVTDAEIDMTLEGYGEWVEDADYGRVWRPYTTVVGADFTPYESCGSWTYTDYGWTFQSCNEWSWGWLPFHFGRWVFLDNSWCWSRDYTWGPGWVEWRHGGGYVGYRPMRPTRQIRDHRDRYSGPRIRDHRSGKNEQWSFTPDKDFGRGRIRPSRSIGINEGLRATTAVAQPPLRGERNRVSTVMAGRLRDHQRFDVRTRGQIGQSTRGYQPSRGYTNSVGTTPPSRGYPQRGYNNSVGASRGYNPTYNPSVVSPNAQRPTWNRSGNVNGGYRYNPPSNGGYRAPNHGGYRYNPPSDTGVNRGYRYNPPSNTRTPPTNNGGYRYSPPSNGGVNGGYRYNPPSRSNPPARGSSWGGSRGSAPSPSTWPSSNWGGSRSSSPSPSRSYSAPSRSSSSYSSPSRSSSSSTRGSSSSSSSSRGSSSSGGSRGRR